MLLLLQPQAGSLRHLSLSGGCTTLALTGAAASFKLVRSGSEVFARRARLSPLPVEESQAEQQAAEFEARRLAGDAARSAVARATASAALSLQNEGNAAPDAGAVGARLGEQLLALQQSALQAQAEKVAQGVAAVALEESRALEVKRVLEARNRDEEQALLMILIEFA